MTKRQQTKQESNFFVISKYYFRIVKLITKYIFRIALERAFTQNQKPTSEEVYYISESLNMEKVREATKKNPPLLARLYFLWTHFNLNVGFRDVPLSKGVLNIRIPFFSVLYSYT